MKEEKKQLRKSVSDTQFSKSKGPGAAEGLAIEGPDEEPARLQRRGLLSWETTAGWWAFRFQ